MERRVPAEMFGRLMNRPMSYNVLSFLRAGKSVLNALPDLHRSFAEQLEPRLQSDPRIHSLLADGSFIRGGFDRYSDLNFVMVVDLLYYDETTAQRMVFAGTPGHLLHAFTGKHVGESCLLICLLGPQLLYVDMKFITLDMLTQRVEEPAVLFTHDSDALERQLVRFSTRWPSMTSKWSESRAWIWLHYAVVKLGRRELFEAMGMLSFPREQVLKLMLFRRVNLPQCGVRRIKALGIDSDDLLTSTPVTYDRHSVGTVIRRAIDAYVTLRADALPDNTADDTTHRAVLAILGAYSGKG